MVMLFFMIVLLFLEKHVYNFLCIYANVLANTNRCLVNLTFLQADITKYIVLQINLHVHYLIYESYSHKKIAINNYQ